MELGLYSTTPLPPNKARFWISDHYPSSSAAKPPAKKELANMSSNQSSKKHPQWMKPLTNPDKKSDPSFGGAALGAALYSANHEVFCPHISIVLGVADRAAV